MSLSSLEDNTPGSRLNAKTDQELLREFRTAQIHSDLLARLHNLRGMTPEPSDAQGNVGDDFDIMSKSAHHRLPSLSLTLSL